MEASVSFNNVNSKVLYEVFMKFDSNLLTVRKIVAMEDIKKYLNHF